VFIYDVLCAGGFGTDAVETGIPVEVWRYYLLAAAQSF
jgi:hypothetical protein